MTQAPAASVAPDQVHHRGRVTRLIRWALIVGILTWSAQGVGLDLGTLREGQRGAALLIEGLLRPDLSRQWLSVCRRAAVETVHIAVVGLALAALLAAPMSLALATNVRAPRPLREGARAIAAFLRGVPDLLWALLLVAALGPGPAAGAVAIGIHGAGALAKLWAEQLESVDPAPVEAMNLMGARRVATASLAIVPLARGGLISLLLYQAECNIRASTVLGFVGAGGIGQELAISLKLFRYEQLSTLIVAVLVLMFATDLLSRIWRLRRADRRAPLR
ncbi:MAG: PhnE/PtxC family ABC transporter permease [Nocardioides sp.]